MSAFIVRYSTAQGTVTLLIEGDEFAFLAWLQERWYPQFARERKLDAQSADRILKAAQA